MDISPEVFKVGRIMETQLLIRIFFSVRDLSEEIPRRQLELGDIHFERQYMSMLGNN